MPKNTIIIPKKGVFAMEIIAFVVITAIVIKSLYKQIKITEEIKDIDRKAGRR